MLPAEVSVAEPLLAVMPAMLRSPVVVVSETEVPVLPVPAVLAVTASVIVLPFPKYP